MKRQWSMAGVAVACVLVGVPCESATGLTPDKAIEKLAERLEEERGAAEAELWLRDQQELEEILIQLAEVVALGRTVSSDAAVGAGNRVHTEVVFDVEQCLKGCVDDTIVFWHAGGATEGRVTYGTGMAEYKVGERAIVVLSGGTGDGACLYGTGEERKYAIRDGIVVRKGIREEEFIAELEDLLARRRPLALFERAEYVAVGTFEGVTETRASNVRERSVPPERWVTLQVKRCLKGQLGATAVRVDLPPHGTLRYGDVPPLDQAEEVAVFLDEGPEGSFRLVGGKAAVTQVRDLEELLGLR